MNKNNVLIELCESDRVQHGRVAFADQSVEQRVFSAIWALEAEVNNGGFNRYFLSGDGDTAEFAVYPDDLTELLFAYVSAHPDVFGPVAR